jgi:hypothetical protein
MASSGNSVEILMAQYETGSDCSRLPRIFGEIVEVFLSRRAKAGVSNCEFYSFLCDAQNRIALTADSILPRKKPPMPSAKRRLRKANKVRKLK